VEELIQAEADINASDENGKSALHWAASVNNVDAVNTLLAHGANRDAQDNKDETPLFLSCREGSYQAAKALLDHCANRDITDHMDRLPTDVAQERLHHDIVRLLAEHIPPVAQPQVQVPLPSQSIASENPNSNQVQMTPTKPRPKKRSKTVEGSPMEGSMHSPPMLGLSMNGMATLPKNRRPSFKKKKDGHEMSGMMMSPESDHHMYSQHLLAASHPNLENIMPHGQNPPSYEVAMHHQSMASGLQGSQQQMQESQQFYGMHPRQQSIPASMTYNPHMSPPIMSPPQSVQSTHSLSPPGVTSPQMTHQTSPLKNRGPILPTSPTHIAAMRGASHQRLQSFDFPPDAQTQQQMTHQGMLHPGNYPYLPTPPQQTGESNSNFMTPSPESQHQDSPGQWSSNSPQSHSDWSETLSPSATYQNQLKQQQDGIFI